VIYSLNSNEVVEILDLTLGLHQI